MATFAQLQTRVTEIVIDTPTAITSQVPTLIRESVRRLTRLHDFKVCEATTEVFETSLETRVLGAVPSNFYKWRGKPYLISEQGRVRELGTFPDRASAMRVYGTEDGGEADPTDLSGPPKFLSLSEPSDELGTMNFELWPLPDEESLFTDGNYRIAVPYYKYLTALSGNSDTNWFTNNAEQWLAWDAASQAFFLNWDEQRALTWAQNAAKAYKEVIDADKKLRFSEVTELTPSSDARDLRGQYGDNTRRLMVPFNYLPG